MTALAQVPVAGTGYRHEAVFWDGEDDFAAGTTAFIADGLAAGQEALVALTPAHLDVVRARLGAAADRVHFVDMTELGRNPARLIPAWQTFLGEYCRPGRPVRGVGEPIWPGRSDSEVVESQLHEALLNLAIPPSASVWLRCTYDVRGLPSAVVEEARRSHPVVVQGERRRRSPSYGGIAHAEATLQRELPEPAGPVEALAFGEHDLADLRALVSRQATGFVDQHRVDDLVLAVHEVAANSLDHGGGKGSLRVWTEPGAIVCEVRDEGRIEDPLIGRRLPGLHQTRGRGLWLANQLCDLVQLRTNAEGTVVRMLMWRSR